MATRRALRTERDQAVALADGRLARIRELEASLDAVSVSRAGATRREAGMADRIISLSRALKRTQQQLSDALGPEDPQVTVGARWQERREDRPWAGGAKC
jgi:HAMP domain-containing protein